MSWLSQKEGIISHTSNMKYGVQPIRVLHYMLLYMFQNTNSTFYMELKNEIEKGKVNKEIDIICDEKSIRKENGKFATPRVNGETRKIELSETFLSYLWACTYAIFVSYVEEVNHPFLNKKAGKDIYPIDEKNSKEALEVFEYAKLLIVDYIPWDKKELPNPEIYLAEKRTYVEQTNIFYTEAVKFILCHEFTHLKLHIDEISTETSDSKYLLFEKEADDNAIEKMKKGISYLPTPFATAHRFVVEIGAVIGVLSMFFFKATTEDKQHPNAEDRLTNVLEKFELNSNHEAWGIACVGLKFWDKQFGHYFDWGNSLDNFKSQYYSIVKQIKDRYTN